MANSKNAEYVANHIRKRKKDLIEVLGGKCCICGFDAFQSALEFHHVNPEEKSFSITDSGAVTKALDKQLEELRKCVLVCANCHRGIHNGFCEVPKDYQKYFNEEVAKRLQDENFALKNGIANHCKICGKLISRGATYCVSCGQKVQRKVERPSREELKKLIRTTSFVKIAEQYKVTDNAIRKWCKSYDLPFRKFDINLISDEDWENI